MWHRRAPGKSPLGGIEVKRRETAPKAPQIGGEQRVAGRPVTEPSEMSEIMAPMAHRTVHRREPAGGRRDDRRVGQLAGAKAVTFEPPMSAPRAGQKRGHAGVAITGGQAAIQAAHQTCPGRLAPRRRP